MEEWVHASVHGLLLFLALPRVGLSAIFVISLVSATLLPLGSEPAVFGFVKITPHMFWPAVLVATAGNTLGGVITYYMGLGAEKAFERWKEKHEHGGHGGAEPETGGGGSQSERGSQSGPGGGAAAGGRRPSPRLAGGRWHRHISQWVHRMGPGALFFSWLPIVGDPLCAVAGWLRLPFWPSVLFMTLGKFLRYAIMTAALLWVFPNLS